MAQMVLERKLDRARVYGRSLVAARGAAWTAALFLAAFLLCFHLDRTLVLSVEARVAAWLGMGALAGAALIALVLIPLLRPSSPEQLAILVERRYPHLRERLLSAVEFRGARTLEGVSPALVADLQAEAEREAGPLRFESAFDRRPLRRALLMLGSALLLVALHALLQGPAFGAFLSRMALGNTPVWRDTRAQVEPLRARILRGSDLAVRVEQDGRHVERATLHFRIADGRWNRVELRAGPDGGFTHVFRALGEPVAYYARAGDGISDRGEAAVVDPAAVVGARLRFEYPAYQDRAPLTVTSDSGGIAAPVGTRVALELRASKPLESATAALGKSAPEPWSVEGDTVRGSLVVRGTTSYTLRLKDADGFLAPEPQSFPIRAVRDEAPELRLVEPEGDLDVVPDARVRLVVQASDDYGVDQVRIPYEAGRQKTGVLPAGRGGKRARSLEVESFWSLAALRLRPGDTVRYRVEATDHDNVTGPHVGKTGEFQLRVIDRGEAERRYQEARQSLARQLADLIREQRGARGDVERQRAAAAPDSDALASAEERQRAAAASAADLARRIAEANRMAETNRLAGGEDLDSQRAAQQALERLAQEAMPQAAERIGAAQSQARSEPQRSRSSLGEASEQQKQILEELGRVAGRLNPGSELQRMAERLSRLAAEQRTIQRQSESLLPQTLGRTPEELTPAQRERLQALAREQASLRAATAQAQQDLERAARSMEATSPEQAEAARQAQQGLEGAQVTEQQSQAAQNTQRNALGQARQQQQDAARALEEAAEELRQALSPSDPKALERQLQQAASRLNRMLQQQAEAIEQTRRLMSPEERRQLAEQQRQLQEQARQLARQLQRLQRRSPSAARAAQAMEQAGQQLGQAARSLSEGEQQEALGREQRAQQQMRQAMQSLQQAMAEARQEEDPFAELRKSLQRLSARQKEIRESTQRVDREQQETGVRPDHAAELDRLARQQTDLESAAAKLEPELPGEVFRAFSSQARRAMERSAGGLSQANPKPDPTQDAQQRAQTLLDQLARALEPDPNDDGESEGGGGGGEGGGGEPDPELPKRIAELRLLRYMEQAIKGQTEEIDRRRPENGPITDSQAAEIDELARQQAQARAMAERAARALGRYRNLAGRVAQAGKHMGEANRGLDQKQTGDGVQEQEEQAILRLTDALRQAQQQQQQQQQQARRRQQQQQQQARRQQMQQQQRQAQQQGSRPALESRVRPAGRQDGALGGIGASDRGFANLDPRSQDALRQGFRERVPAEYQDLVARYLRALSEKGR